MLLESMGGHPGNQGRRELMDTWTVMVGTVRMVGGLCEALTRFHVEHQCTFTDAGSRKS